jgi:sigma-E factor negative regulatory protein RseC
MAQMMDHFGLVMEPSGDDKAIVKIRQNSACGKCGKCSFIGDPATKGQMLVEAVNPIGAQSGQLVKIESKTADVLMAAVLLYIFPLIGLLAGLFGGRNWALNAMPATNADLFGLAVGLGCMVIVFFILRKGEVYFTRQKRFTTTITAIVSEDDIPEEILPES